MIDFLLVVTALAFFILAFTSNPWFLLGSAYAVLLLLASQQ